MSTDSREIAKIAAAYGASIPFIRPGELASDDARTIDAVLHAVRHPAVKKYDILVLLQPTQPLRTAQDIDSAIEFFFEKDAGSLVSVSPVDDHPYLIRSIDASSNAIPLLNVSSTHRRQDLPSYYRVNGCIYINWIRDLTEQTSFNDNQVAFVLPSSHSVDIDEEKDIFLADYYLRHSAKESS